MKKQKTAAKPETATRFTFRDAAGHVPVVRGKVGWLRDRQKTIEEARSWGGSELLEISESGRVLKAIPLADC